MPDDGQGQDQDRDNSAPILFVRYTLCPPDPRLASWPLAPDPMFDRFYQANTARIMAEQEYHTKFIDWHGKARLIQAAKKRATAEMYAKLGIENPNKTFKE